MWSDHLSAARRAAPALALAATLLVSALGSPAPMVAAAEPTARLQIVIKQVTIHDDREGALSGQGEMLLHATIWRCNEGIPPPCFAPGFDPEYGPRGVEMVASLLHKGIAGTAEPIARMGRISFNASTGATVPLDRPVPQAGDLMWGGNTSEQLGFAVYAGRQYVVQFAIEETDGGFTDREYLGYVLHVVDAEEHGLGLGTHTARSVVDDGPRAGDYTITYEIRRTPLPDLRPSQITVHDLPGSAKKRVCTGVQNVDLVDAGPFELALRVDGVVPPAGRAVATGMPSGTGRELCVETELPASGQHVLTTTVDDRRQVAEYDETNNVLEQAYQPIGPTPTPTPRPALADLTVGAIRVNGRVPDGKDDCKDGRNDVAVVVMNGGTANAGAFAVRLQVDGAADQTTEEAVPGLEAGQEREVRFDDVRLKKGEREFTATADASKTVDESDEDNNARTVSARCKDDE